MIIIFENDKDDDDDDPVRWQPGHNGSPYPAPPTPAQCLLCKIKTIPLCICARCTVYTNHCKLYLYVYLCICGRWTPTTVSCTSPTVRYAALSSSPLHWVTLHIRLCLQDQHRPVKHMVSDTRPRPMYFTAANCSTYSWLQQQGSTCSWLKYMQLAAAAAAAAAAARQLRRAEICRIGLRGCNQWRVGPACILIHSSKCSAVLPSVGRNV